MLIRSKVLILGLLSMLVSPSACVPDATLAEDSGDPGGSAGKSGIDGAGGEGTGSWMNAMGGMTSSDGGASSQGGGTGGVAESTGGAAEGGTGGAIEGIGGTGTGGADVGTGGTGTGGESQGSGGMGTGGDQGSGGAFATGGTGGASNDEPPSCQQAQRICGPSGDDSCCTSLMVPGGTFNRSNDWDYPATVSAFRLDKYEVSVGRFRSFVGAWQDGWRPLAGDGKHTHLNSGSGLENSHAAGAYEPGWDVAWESSADPTDENLSCDATFATWTSAPGANEARPMNCVNWFEAYAFCIWDGGFLPSEAETSFAASGGNEHRYYPWSTEPDPFFIDCTFASYVDCDGVDGTGAERLTPVGIKGNGDARFGQSDLSGNVREWNLDWYAEASTGLAGSCIDCAYLPATATHRVRRTGSYLQAAANLRNAGIGTRGSTTPISSHLDLGLRCARVPSE